MLTMEQTTCRVDWQQIGTARERVLPAITSQLPNHHKAHTHPKTKGKHQSRTFKFTCLWYIQTLTFLLKCVELLIRIRDRSDYKSNNKQRAPYAIVQPIEQGNGKAKPIRFRSNDVALTQTGLADAFARTADDRCCTSADTT